MSRVMLPNPVAIHYVAIKEPSSYQGSDPRYSVRVVIRKDDKVNLQALDEAITAAKNSNLAKKWPKVPDSKLSILSKVEGQKMYDGDTATKEDGSPVGPEFKGCWFFNAYADLDKPPITMRRIPRAERTAGGPVVEKADPGIFYSGCIVKIDLNIFARNRPSKGIGAQPNALIFIKDGVRSDGGATEASVIAAYTDEEDEEDAPMTDDFNE